MELNGDPRNTPSIYDELTLHNSPQHQIGGNGVFNKWCC